jgi:hypothetical protein
VILVEWPNDVLVYQYAIEQKIKEKIADRGDIDDKDLYSKTYLNFENIVIVPHHGKTTAHVLIELCKHFKVDFFVITDLDFYDQNMQNRLLTYSTEEEMKVWVEYTTESSSTKKWEITKNWKLIKAAGDNIHFNIPKLEKVINYDSDDKDSIWIFQAIKDYTITNELFPKSLEKFLELEKIENSSS